ncbi:MAG: DNA-binding protein [Candidatus Pacebacteria bacterium CG_4_10_14_0_8_um_filter_43_12]|nr:MAG: DNA-binding protein [Candidatus Pacebacteria bacterium CG_4_10_14_0_8_um_filter_43_12]
MKTKIKKITVQGREVSIMLHAENEDFISLTDMLKAKDGDFFISDWLRNRNTVEFLGIWEKLHNTDFNYGEFATIKSKAGLNSYKISVKEWVSKTKAIGLKATTGRYGGTYAHKDIAFEFGMWISPEFKIYLINEFQRLKQEENVRLEQGWDVKRVLAKINYKIHTDADVTQLVVLANLEGINAELIRQGLSQPDRIVQLNQIAISQMQSLLGSSSVKKLKT